MRCSLREKSFRWFTAQIEMAFCLKTSTLSVTIKDPPSLLWDLNTIAFLEGTHLYPGNTQVVKSWITMLSCSQQQIQENTLSHKTKLQCITLKMRAHLSSTCGSKWTLVTTSNTIGLESTLEFKRPLMVVAIYAAQASLTTVSSQENSNTLQLLSFTSTKSWTIVTAQMANSATMRLEDKTNAWIVVDTNTLNLVE